MSGKKQHGNNSWVTVGKKSPTNQNQNPNQNQELIEQNIKEFFCENCSYHYMYVNGCTRKDCQKKHQSKDSNFYQKLKETLIFPIQHLKLDNNQIIEQLKEENKKIKLGTCINFLSGTKCGNINRGKCETITLNIMGKEFSILVCYSSDKYNNGNKMYYLHLNFDFTFRGNELEIKNISSDTKNPPIEEEDSTKNIIYEEEFPTISGLAENSGIQSNGKSVYETKNTQLLSSPVFTNLDDLLWYYKFHGIKKENITDEMLKLLIGKIIESREEIERLRDILNTRVDKYHYVAHPNSGESSKKYQKKSTQKNKKYINHDDYDDWEDY